MKLQHEHTFDDYFTSGEKSVRNLLNENGSLIRALKRNHDYFVKVLWSDEHEVEPIAGLLGINAFMMLLAGIRIAMTGHAAAIFPTLRTALEYACYAFLITDNPALATIWSDRNKDDASLRSSRGTFTGAVRAAANRLNEIQQGSGNWILEAYDTAIDFGAHPNPRGVIGHISFPPKGSGATYQEVNIIGLYTSEHFETERALVACLDFGLAIAVVLTRCRMEYSERIQRELDELHYQKESVTTELSTRNSAPHTE